MRTFLAAATLLVGVALPFTAEAAGNLASRATDIQVVMNGRDLTLSPAEIQLETGKYYRLSVTSDGIDEFRFRAPEFWRNTWISQIVINDIEVHMLGAPEGVEFDAAGEALIFFVPVRPGDFEFFVQGQEDRGMKGMFVVR